MEKYISGLGLHVLIVAAIFLLMFLIQVYFYLRFYRKAFLKTPSIYDKPENKTEPVSIIICARNEASNLEKNLPLILEQDYPDFEVIVVNDRSEDETGDVLKRFAAIYPRLHISEVRKDPLFTHGKKLALTLGIKASANEWLLLTDADCVPAGKNWLSIMQRNFISNRDIVLGYGGYKKEKGILNLLIRVETLFTAMQYMGMAVAGKPYRGVGRNLPTGNQFFLLTKDLRHIPIFIPVMMTSLSTKQPVHQMLQLRCIRKVSHGLMLKNHLKAGSCRKNDTLLQVDGILLKQNSGLCLKM